MILASKVLPSTTVDKRSIISKQNDSLFKYDHYNRAYSIYPYQESTGKNNRVDSPNMLQTDPFNGPFYFKVPVIRYTISIAISNRPKIEVRDGSLV